MDSKYNVLKVDAPFLLPLQKSQTPFLSTFLRPSPAFQFTFFPFISLLSSSFSSTSVVVPFYAPLMDVSQIYATAAGGFFLLFILLNFLSQTVRERIALFTSKHLTSPYFLHRHRLLGPWTRSDVLIQLIYITTNSLCLGFRASTLSTAGLQAGNLSLANMVPLFAGPHLSFLAGVLGFRLDLYHYVHRSAGLMSFTLSLFHVLVVVIQRPSFSLNISEHLYGTIVCSPPRSRCLTLTLYRQDHAYVYLCYSPTPSCADPPTKSSCECTKHWPSFLPTQSGIIYRRIYSSHACTFISPRRYSSLRRWSNVSASCGGMGPSATVTPEPSSLMLRARSRLRSDFLGR